MRSLFPKVFQINSDNQLEIDIDRDLLKKHAAIVMEGLGAVVEIMDDSDFLNNVLISIGQTHYHRHVRPSMLKVSIDKKERNYSDDRLASLCLKLMPFGSLVPSPRSN